MLRSLTAIFALAASLVGPAGAVTVWVDNFDQHDLFVWNGGAGFPAADATPAMSNGLERTLTHAYSGVPPNPEDGWVTSGSSFDDGHLSVVNDVLTSTGTVSWALPVAFIPGTSTHVATLKFDVLGSDQNGVTATLNLGSSRVGAQNFGPVTTTPVTLSFALGASQNVINLSGGTLALVFTGPAGYDMTIDNVRFDVSLVPEASTSMMLLAGLLAIAGLRRRMAQRATASA